MDRRTFVQTLTALVVAPQVVPALPAPKAAPPQDTTLTGRILKSLQRRTALSQPSRAICVSFHGFRQIEREHGLEHSGLLSLHGVPGYAVPDLTGHDYWVFDQPPILSHIEVPDGY